MGDVSFGLPGSQAYAVAAVGESGQLHLEGVGRIEAAGWVVEAALEDFIFSFEYAHPHGAEVPQSDGKHIVGGARADVFRMQPFVHVGAPSGADSRDQGFVAGESSCLSGEGVAVGEQAQVVVAPGILSAEFREPEFKQFLFGEQRCRLAGIFRGEVREPLSVGGAGGDEAEFVEGVHGIAGAEAAGHQLLRAVAQAMAGVEAPERVFQVVCGQLRKNLSEIAAGESVVAGVEYPVRRAGEPLRIGPDVGFEGAGVAPCAAGVDYGRGLSESLKLLVHQPLQTVAQLPVGAAAHVDVESCGVAEVQQEVPPAGFALYLFQNGKLVLGAVVVDRLLISVPEPGQAVALPAGGEGECVEDHRQKQ